MVLWILIFAAGFCAAKVSGYLYVWLRSAWTVAEERLRGEMLKGVTPSADNYKQFGLLILEAKDDEMLMLKTGGIYWMLYIQRWMAKLERGEFDNLNSAWVDLDRNGYNIILEMNRLVIADNFALIGENREKDEKDATEMVHRLQKAIKAMCFPKFGTYETTD